MASTKDKTNNNIKPEDENVKVTYLCLTHYKHPLWLRATSATALLFREKTQIHTETNDIQQHASPNSTSEKLLSI